jgi:hypothetical protein
MFIAFVPYAQVGIRENSNLRISLPEGPNNSPETLDMLRRIASNLAVM